MHVTTSAARRLAGRLALSLLLFLVALELGLRVLAQVAPSPLLATPNGSCAEVIRSWRGRPGGTFNGWTLNSIGMFDTEFSERAIPGTFRVLALADSFGVGVVPYEDNFLTLVDEALDENHPTDVYNFGVPGLAPTDYLHLFRTEAAAFHPELVLLCLFVGNDIEARKPPSAFRLETLYSLALVRRLVALRGKSPDLLLTDDTTPTLTRDTFKAIEFARLQLALKEAPSQEAADWLETAYTYTFSKLEEIHAEVGPRLRVVLIPDEYQVNGKLLDSLLRTQKRPEIFDAEMPSALLRRFLRRQGIPFLDLLPAIREAQQEARTYKPRDTHWNRHGNRAAAEALTPWLENEIKEILEARSE